MKKRFQLIVTLSILILIITGSVIYSVVIRQFVRKEITNQIIQDNRIIGSEVINYISHTVDTSDVNAMLSSLQNICDEVTLPNGGFICVMDEHGELVAGPDFENMEVKNLMIESFTESGEENSFNPSLFNTSETKGGILNYEKGEKTDIISSIPLGSSGYRLNVHQNYGQALDNTNEFFKGVFPLALLVAIGISLIGFIFIDRMVKNYESKLEKQAKIIESKNKDLTSSIRYASFLQKSYLPGRNLLAEMLPESFVLLKPRDIVSGDFFYVKETENMKYFSVIDCTGHGIPGSLLSMIGYGLIEQAITIYKNPSTATILNYLCSKFPEALSNKGEHISTDGMDMAICGLDKNSNELSFSGAKNPIYLVRDNAVTKYKGEKFSVGEYREGAEECFHEEKIKLRKGDMIYLSSDGIIDQFGGPAGKKFMSKNFRNLLLSVAKMPVTDQYTKIDDTIEQWKGKLPQTDDISLMGVRI